MKKFILGLALTFALAPYKLLAVSGAGPGGSNTSNPGSGPGGVNPSNPGPGPGGTNPPSSSLGLQNPLQSDSLIGLLQQLLDIIMVFAVPLIVFMIIYAGFLFVMDRGSGKNLTQAKNALLYSVIGGVLILGANIILYVIEGTVNAFR